MKLFLDTEYNGFGGELLSLALVPEDNTVAWYEVREIASKPILWVQQNVMPVLGKPALRPYLFKAGFQGYIKRFSNPEVICDWNEDAIHFCELLKGQDYGSSLDFACTIRIVKTPSGEPVSSTPHNALFDALALKDWYLKNAD